MFPYNYFRALLFVYFLVQSPVYASFFINPEIGVKQFYTSVEPKDKHDAVLYFGLGYFTRSNLSAELAFISGSVKRENKIRNCTANCVELPFNISYSNSLDILLGKAFSYEQYISFAAGC